MALTRREVVCPVDKDKDTAPLLRLSSSPLVDSHLPVSTSSLDSSLVSTRLIALALVLARTHSQSHSLQPQVASARIKNKDAFKSTAED